VEEDSGESVKSEDREQFNSFQENCDEVVQMESENQELVVESFPFEQLCTKPNIYTGIYKYLHKWLWTIILHPNGRASCSSPFV
jgi:hypothetical protein